MINVILWIFQILLALLFSMGAYRKLSSPAEEMRKDEELPFGGNPVPIKIIGVLELLGVIGIIVPQLINVCVVLTPVTAVCFGLVMIGASIFHIMRRKYKVLPITLLALALSVLVAYYRFTLI